MEKSLLEVPLEMDDVVRSALLLEIFSVKYTVYLEGKWNAAMRPCKLEAASGLQLSSKGDYSC